MIGVLVLIGSILLILLFYWLQKKAAGPRDLRMRLAFDVILSILYAVTVMAVYIKEIFSPTKVTVIDSVPVWLPLLYPAIIYCLFLLIEWLLHWLRNRLYRNEKLQPAFAWFAYVKQKDASLNESWVVSRRLVPYRNMLSKISVSLLVLTIALLVTCTLPMFQYSALWYSIPVAALIASHELSLYLNGPLQVKKADAVIGEGLQGRRESNFAAAAEHLKKTFKDALLFDEFQNLSGGQKASPEDTLQKFERSGDVEDQLIAAYFRSELAGDEINPDYVQMAADLTRHKNVLIRNPFYEDLSRYLALPLSSSLERKRKILVLCQGRDSEKKIASWIRSVLDKRSGFQEKWKVSLLSDLVPDCSVGILSYSDLYNPAVMEKNWTFFAQTEYVLLLQPSSVLTTMQVPLNVLSDLLREGDTAPVFCIIDKNLNSLKDTLSHVLKTKVDSDIAIPSQADMQTVMIWNADADYQAIERFDRQTRFLGGGIEIGAEAVSMQVPETCWISEKDVPVSDLQNNAALSWRSVGKVMKTEPSQRAVREKLQVETEPWSMPRKDAAFLIIEDEAGNPFSAVADYLSRADEEIFINVLSDGYLLRDYFCANADMFLSNPQAIPSLVPDFARTPRNTLLKLILKMNIAPMSEPEILQELDLADLRSEDTLNLLNMLLERYTFAKDDLWMVEKKMKPSVVGKPEYIRYFSVDPDKFDQYFSRSLKNVSVILEDEAVGRNVLDSQLYSLILQTMLPGQFVNYEGKSYQIRRVSPETGVILNRSSDLIDERKRYRQIRRYHHPEMNLLTPISRVTIDGFTFSRYELDFQVDTTGYLEMKNRGDFSSTRVHDLSRDPSYPDLIRSYRQKGVLNIRFPQIGQSELYQIAILLQELLPTVMPEGYPYLALLAKEPQGLNHQFAGIIPEGEPLEDQVLVVVEDSDLDLGLLDEFERYFFDLLAIVQDYLRWNQDRIATEEAGNSEEEEEELLNSTEFITLRPPKDVLASRKKQKLLEKIAWQIEEITLKKMENEEGA